MHSLDCLKKERSEMELHFSEASYPERERKKSIKGFYPKTAKLWENDDPAFMKCSCLNSLPMPSRNNGMTRGIGPPVPLLLLETAPGQTEVSRVNLLTMVPNMPCTSGNWSHL